MASIIRFASDGIVEVCGLVGRVKSNNFNHVLIFMCVVISSFIHFHTVLVYLL